MITELGPLSQIGISVAPSGDTTGATDTAAIQAAINTVYTAGGGIVQLQPAPPTAPFYTTQLKHRSHVTVQGAGRYATVLRAPLGQAAGLHMSVLNDPINDYDCVMRSLCLDGNNGSIPNQTWGRQANVFDGINWVGNPAGGSDIAKLRPPFATDAFCRIEDVLVTQMPGHGILNSGILVSELRQCVTYWTGLEGFWVGSPDNYLEQCSAGFAGVNPGSQLAGFRFGVTSQLNNCKAWWAGITFSYPGGVLTWTVPSGVGFQFDGPGAMSVGCYAQDVGIGYLINNGAKNAYIRGHVSGATQGIQIGEDYGDIDIHVDGVNGQSGVVPKWAVIGVFNKSLPNTKLRVSVDPTVAFATGYFGGNGADNGSHWVGSDIEVRSTNRSQSIAYAAAITPNPYLGPTVKVGTLTGAITINNPPNAADNTPYPDQELELWLPQDATGGRVVTFGAAFKITAAIPTTLSTTTVVKFRWDATNTVWREVARATA